MPKPVCFKLNRDALTVGLFLVARERGKNKSKSGERGLVRVKRDSESTRVKPIGRCGGVDGDEDD